jgi:hypothetical protein
MAEAIHSVSELATEYLQTLNKLELPPDNREIRRRVQKMVEQGCDEKFLLQASYLYALTAHAFRKNAEAERLTTSSSRLIALPGLSMSRRDLANHIRDVRNAARQIE